MSSVQVLSYKHLLPTQYVPTIMHLQFLACVPTGRVLEQRGSSPCMCPGWKVVVCDFMILTDACTSDSGRLSHRGLQRGLFSSGVLLFHPLWRAARSCMGWLECVYCASRSKVTEWIVWLNISWTGWLNLMDMFAWVFLLLVWVFDQIYMGVIPRVDADDLRGDVWWSVAVVQVSFSVRMTFV